MDQQTLQTILAQANFASIIIGFSAGFLFSFNPVALAAIPVSLAYARKAHELKKSIAYGGMFILGMITTHVVLGLIASLGGSWVQQLLGRYWGLILGPVLILLGFMWPGWIKLPIRSINIKVKKITGVWGAFALGVPFSVAICPFCTPALIVILGVAASMGSPLFGTILLLSFALGRALPILLGAVAIGWLESLKILSHYQKSFEVIGAIFLILSGLYLLNSYYFILPWLA